MYKSKVIYTGKKSFTQIYTANNAISHNPISEITFNIE